ASRSIAARCRRHCDMRDPLAASVDPKQLVFFPIIDQDIARRGVGWRATMGAVSRNPRAASWSSYTDAAAHSVLRTRPWRPTREGVLIDWPARQHPSMARLYSRFAGKKG